MNLILLHVLIAITPCFGSKFTWERSKKVRRETKGSKNLSYKEFMEEATVWSDGIRTSLNQTKIPCEQHFLIDKESSNDCYQIEVEAPERDYTFQDREGHREKVGHKSEISLFNLLAYSENKQNKFNKFWADGIDKAKLIMENKIKCEKVILPIENLAMTMATEGSVSFSQIDETSLDKAWKVGSKLDIKTPSLGLIGTVSVTINGYYQESHRSAKRHLTKTTYEATPGSPCTPSLVKTAMWCHPTKAWRDLSRNNTVLYYELDKIDGKFIKNSDGDLFESFTACIDYSRE